MNEKELLRTLQDWLYISKRISALKERIAAQTYSVTANYSADGRGGGTVTSKIERYCLTRAERQDEVKRLEGKLTAVVTALQRTELTKIEKKLITAIMGGGSLRAFARKNKIYQSNVYKMRDKAIKKIFANLDIK